MRIVHLVAALLFITGSRLSAQDSLSAVPIREVVVTGQYAPTDARNTVFPVRVLKRERIEQTGANNLEQLLRQELNLRIGQDMILGSSVSIQGLSGQNVKILLDGIPVIGRTDGNIDLGQINLANIERVEIIEGPASVFYGTDALAGVINLISKRGQAKQWQLGASGQYEQLGERSLAANAGYQPGQKWLLLASGGYDRFEGFDTSATQRNQLWNPKSQYYGDACLRYSFGNDQFIRLKTAWFNETIDNPGDIRRPQYKPYAFDDRYRTGRRDLAFLHEGTLFNTLYWNNSVGLNLFEREKEVRRTEIETGERSLIPGEQDTSRFRSLSLRSIIAAKKPRHQLQWLAGIDARTDQGFGRRIRDTLSQTQGRSSLTDAALLGSLRYLPGARTVVETGLRAGWNSRYRGAVVPSFTLKQRLGERLDARATYARGFRSPDLKELYFYFVDVNHYVIGNPELQPEKSDNVHMSLNYDNPFSAATDSGKSKNNFRATQLQLSCFWNRISDKIELYEFVETDHGMEPVGGDTATFRYAYFNVESYETRGATLRTAYAWRSFRLALGGNITGFYNPYHADFPATPKFTYTHELNLSTVWQYKSWNAGVWLRSNDRFIRYYPETANGETLVHQRTIGGYTDVETSVGKKFWKQRLYLQAGVRNLLNVQSAAVSGSAGGVHSSEGAQPVSPGRNVWVKCSVNL